MRSLFVATALVIASLDVWAQAWPAKPIRIIVPAVGGSAVDVGMRRVAPKLAEALGQPVIVENRPGANSMIGAREVARMPADGYTLLHANINNALNDLLAGHVMTGFLAPSAVAQHIKAGKLRALALADPARIGILSDVPTTTEAGLPALQATGWNGLYAPAGTPEPIIRRLQAELARALAAPDIREDAKTNGWVLGGDQPEEFAAYVRAEMAKWGRIIQEAKIKLQ